MGILPAKAKICDGDNKEPVIADTITPGWGRFIAYASHPAPKPVISSFHFPKPLPWYQGREGGTSQIKTKQYLKSFAFTTIYLRSPIYHTFVGKNFNSVAGVFAAISKRLCNFLASPPHSLPKYSVLKAVKLEAVLPCSSPSRPCYYLLYPLLLDSLCLGGCKRRSDGRMQLKKARYLLNHW